MLAVGELTLEASGPQVDGIHNSGAWCREGVDANSTQVRYANILGG